ncbi:hypothetical protein N431DRAFT_430828 [Stipitochalara longipes BDJ]|nr:hypothetical protein N431DRAFT_430828 [Stipitochalara longipes BDJ]
MPANSKTNGRFQLPQLTPITYSLTEGTNIPPPPDSPVEEKPLFPAAKPEVAAVSVPATNGQSLAPNNSNGVYDGRGRTSSHDQPPMSPASSKRPSSIRRFLSRKSLYSSYSNGDHNGSQEDVTMIDRPESSLSFVDGSPGLRTKKSGSWFRRLGSGSSGNRSSMVYEEKKVVPMGPPPPKLPELNQLKAKIPEDDEGSLGAEDIFKNIK